MCAQWTIMFQFLQVYENFMTIECSDFNGVLWTYICRYRYKLSLCTMYMNRTKGNETSVPWWANDGVYPIHTLHTFTEDQWVSSGPCYCLWSIHPPCVHLKLGYSVPPCHGWSDVSHEGLGPGRRSWHRQWNRCICVCARVVVCIFNLF